MTQGIGDYLKIHLNWQDNTRYGSILSGRIQNKIQQELYTKTFAQLKAWLEDKVEINNRLLTDTVRFERSNGDYQALLKDPEFLHPPVAQTLPDKLYLSDIHNSVSAVIPLQHLNPHQLVAALRADEIDIPLPLAAVLNKTQHSLQEYKRPSLAEQPVIIVGHACVSLFYAGMRIWLDPFFLPKHPRYQSWQPLSVLDLPAEQHCVLFTHSHPDHFDPASLLLFPSNTLFLVPSYPEGESLLTIDIAFRLRQLGFENIKTVNWWEQIDLDIFTITSLPFYGEQAVSYGAESPLLWNHGSTWHIKRKHDNKAFLFLADSGSDPRSYVTNFARQIKQALGKVTFLFGNCRRWRLYPAQYIISSVPQYLVVTPDSELTIPQTIMLEAHELAAFAEIVEADYVVPYAMGGTPWFIELGLGYAYENHLATDFDTDPYEVLKGSRIMLRLPPAFQQLDAKAGSYLDNNEILQIAPEYLLKTKHIEDAKDYVLTLISSEIQVGSNMTKELIQLATLAPKLAFTLSTNFCEFWLPKEDSFTQHILSAWLEHFSDSFIMGEVSQTISVFNESREWTSLARQLLQSAHQSLLANDGELLLINTLQISPYRVLNSELFNQVYQGLTGLTIRIEFQASDTKVFNELPFIELPEPIERSGLLSLYSNQEVALALLISKCLHNSYLTRLIAGKTQQTEQAFIEQLFV